MVNVLIIPSFDVMDNILRQLGTALLSVALWNLPDQCFIMPCYVLLHLYLLLHLYDEIY